MCGMETALCRASRVGPGDFEHFYSVLSISASMCCNQPRPGGTYFVASRQRLLKPEEKLLLQGVPLDLVDTGANTPSELSRLAGNSMHLRSVGAAWCCAFSAVDARLLNTANREFEQRLG